jgi:hypothetical protein
MTLLLVSVYLIVLVRHVTHLVSDKDEDVQHSDPGVLKCIDEERRMRKAE